MHGSLLHHHIHAIKVQQSILEAAHGLAVNVHLSAADLVAVLGGGLRTTDPGELAPLLTAELALGATHVVEVQDIARMTDEFDVVLRLQEIREGLRIDQAAAEAMEDHGHLGKDEGGIMKDE